MYPRQLHGSRKGSLYVFLWGVDLASHTGGFQLPARAMAGALERAGPAVHVDSRTWRGWEAGCRDKLLVAQGGVGRLGRAGATGEQWQSVEIIYHSSTR
jgi:hypothetical protein